MSTTDIYLPTSLVTSLLAFVLILFAIKFKQVNQGKPFSKSGHICANNLSGVPSVPLLVLLGTSLKLRFDLYKIIEFLFTKYGEVYQLNYFGLRNIVYTSNPSIVQKIYMSTDPGLLHKPSLYSKSIVGPLSDGLVVSSPQTWKLHRSVISRAYAYKGLLRQLNIYEEHAKKFVLTLQESIASSSSDNPNVSFPNQVHRLTFEIILHIAAGSTFQEHGENEDQTGFRNNFDGIKELIAYRFNHLIFYPDLLWYLNPRKWEMDQRLDEISEYCYKFVNAVRKQFDAEEKNGINQEDDDMGGRSLVEVMINGGLSNEQIFAQIVTFFFAGQETVSNSLSVLLFLLARHQNYQRRCQKEIDQMFDQMHASNSSELSMEALKSLTFLDVCIKESARLYPVFPMIGRSLESPVKIDDNLYLSKDTWVLVHITSIHRNPRIYPEPDKFLPERFSPENKNKFGPCEFMPFSAGIRNCIAYKSAMIQLKVMAAYVLRNFEVYSDMTMNELECLVKETTWPSFPVLDVKVHPRQ